MKNKKLIAIAIFIFSIMPFGFMMIMNHVYNKQVDLTNMLTWWLPLTTISVLFWVNEYFKEK